MNIDALMSKNPSTCSPNDTVDCAARIMWEKDCGAVPVVDNERRVVGMITDRDLCIAAYTQNKLLAQIPISSIGMKQVVTVRSDDSAQTAESLMQKHQIRRLAVVDDGNRLVGMLSLADLTRYATRSPREISSDEVARTIAEIGRPRPMHASPS